MNLPTDLEQPEAVTVQRVYRDSGAAAQGEQPLVRSMATRDGGAFGCLRRPPRTPSRSEACRSATGQSPALGAETSARYGSGGAAPVYKCAVDGNEIVFQFPPFI